jgi:hypothetical protein
MITQSSERDHGLEEIVAARFTDGRWHIELGGVEHRADHHAEPGPV